MSTNFQVNIKPYKTSISDSIIEFDTEYVTNMLEYAKVIVENEANIINDCEFKGNKVSSSEIELELIFMLRYFLNVNMNLKSLTAQTDNISQNFINEAATINSISLENFRLNAVNSNSPAHAEIQTKCEEKTSAYTSDQLGKRKSSSSPRTTSSSFSPEPEENVEEEGEEHFFQGSSKRRTKLSQRATKVLQEFFCKNINHPYPTDIEKQELAVLAGLSSRQVSNWLTNTRKRIWQQWLQKNGVTGTPILRPTERHEMPNLKELGLVEGQLPPVKNPSRTVSRFPFQLPPLPPLPADLFGDHSGSNYNRPKVSLTNPNSLLLLPTTSSQLIASNSLLSRPLSLSPFTRLPSSFYAPPNTAINRPN